MDPPPGAMVKQLLDPSLTRTVHQSLPPRPCGFWRRQSGSSDPSLTRTVHQSPRALRLLAKVLWERIAAGFCTTEVPDRGPRGADAEEPDAEDLPHEALREEPGAREEQVLVPALQTARARACSGAPHCAYAAWILPVVKWYHFILRSEGRKRTRRMRMRMRMRRWGSYAFRGEKYRTRGGCVKLHCISERTPARSRGFVERRREMFENFASAFHETSRSRRRSLSRMRSKKGTS